MTTPVQPHELYLQQMVEVKRRFHAADRILGAKKPLTRDHDIDNEFVFLQIRRIVELITFSAIVPDKRRYQRARELDALTKRRDKGDYTADWNAPDILVRLSKISPHFLPRPLGLMEIKPDGTKHFNEAVAKLTLDRLISIYKIAGGYAHTANPYKANVAELETQKKAKARATLVKELAFLKSVIWEHVKIGLTWAPGTDPTQLNWTAGKRHGFYGSVLLVPIKYECRLPQRSEQRVESPSFSYRWCLWWSRDLTLRSSGPPPAWPTRLISSSSASQTKLLPTAQLKR